MTEIPITWLTQEAYDRLQSELADREGPLRGEITMRISTARDEGDLKENGGYHAAREEQGKNEARIRQLKQLLEYSRIGVPESAEDEVAPGKVITVRFSGSEDTETFLLGSREESAHAAIDVYSPTSPLGEAVMHRSVGDTATYSARDREITVQIVKVEAYDH
jgi:transcription elongation factor GreA